VLLRHRHAVRHIQPARLDVVKVGQCWHVHAVAAKAMSSGCLAAVCSLLLVKHCNSTYIPRIFTAILHAVCCVQLPTPVKVMQMCLNRQGKLLLANALQFGLTFCLHALFAP
jgi:hypothetical protein